MSEISSETAKSTLPNGSKGEGANLASKTSKAHFWISAAPFFKMSLLSTLHPSLSDNSQKAADTNLIKLTVFDCDGQIINQISIGAERSQLIVTEVEQILLGAKLQSGLTQAHLIVESPKPAQHLCYLHTPDGACMLHQLGEIDDDYPSFFPVSLTKDRTAFMGLVNFSQNPATVVVKLISGTRSPETSVIIPPKGARFLDIGSDLPLKASAEKGIQGYLKVRSNHNVGACFFDYARQRDIFRVICSQ